MKDISLIGILLMLVSHLTFAQDASSDFKKMNKVYLDHAHISMKIDYKFYENHTSTAIIDQQKAVFKRSGSKYYYNMNGITTIQNDKYKLAVHNEDKVLLIGKKDREIDASIFTGTIIDSVLKFCKRVDYQKSANGNKLYTLQYQESAYFPYKKIVVELKSDASLSSITIYYAHPINYTPDDNDIEEPPRLEINYDNTSWQPIPSSQYSLSKYLKIHEQSVNPVEKYSRYRFINQLM